ncbi:60S acidic ribosomal protein P0 [Morella rubra]|uniref:60S acidic ribosomal protein P0 n=1 Tax=Morella rubra TaxID=262757 RepID=A0A6A1V5H0_9ROSI|nr:60S acidic ribosomal protein P0 [Morella rubra]
MTFLSLIPFLVGNVGLIFMKGDLKEVTEEVAKNKVGALAHAGLVAPIDVIVPPSNTKLDPSQISFFHVFNIPTKINNVFIPEVLNLTVNDLMEKFAIGASLVIVEIDIEIKCNRKHGSMEQEELLQVLKLTVDLVQKRRHSSAIEEIKLLFYQEWNLLRKGAVLLGL